MGLLNGLMCMDAAAKFKKFAFSADITEDMVKAGGKEAKRRMSVQAFSSSSVPTVDMAQEGVKTAKRVSMSAASGVKEVARRMSATGPTQAAAREPLLSA